MVAADNGPHSDEYRGTMTLPGEQEPRPVSVFFSEDDQSATVRFEEAVAGASEWEGTQVRIVRRLKYEEVVFITTGLPKETVELIWKVNADLHDGTAAAVVVARPNEHRVTGEKGFILVRAD